MNKYDNEKQGFRVTQLSGEVQRIRATYNISYLNTLTYDFDVNEVKHELTNRLANQLINSNMIMTYESPYYNTGENVVIAEIKVVKSDKDYVNYSGEKFVLKNQEFTNEELIEAVKQTFPERFI